MCFQFLWATPSQSAPHWLKPGHMVPVNAHIWSAEGGVKRKESVGIGCLSAAVECSLCRGQTRRHDEDVGCEADRPSSEAEADVVYLHHSSQQYA